MTIVVDEAKPLHGDVGKIDATLVKERHRLPSGVFALSGDEDGAGAQALEPHLCICGSAVRVCGGGR